MALGNKTLDDLLAPITKQLEHESIAETIEMPEWEFKAVRVTDGMSNGELVDLFSSEAEKIRVQVKRCAPDQLAESIASIVSAGVPDSGEACSVVCADDELFARAGVADAVAAIFAYKLTLSAIHIEQDGTLAVGHEPALVG